MSAVSQSVIANLATAVLLVDSSNLSATNLLNAISSGVADAGILNQLATDFLSASGDATITDTANTSDLITGILNDLSLAIQDDYAAAAAARQADIEAKAAEAAKLAAQGSVSYTAGSSNAAIDFTGIDAPDFTKLYSLQNLLLNPLAKIAVTGVASVPTTPGIYVDTDGNGGYILTTQVSQNAIIAAAAAGRQGLTDVDTLFDFTDSNASGAVPDISSLQSEANELLSPKSITVLGFNTLNAFFSTTGFTLPIGVGADIDDKDEITISPNFTAAQGNPVTDGSVQVFNFVGQSSPDYSALTESLSEVIDPAHTTKTITVYGLSDDQLSNITSGLNVTATTNLDGSTTYQPAPVPVAQPEPVATVYPTSVDFTSATAATDLSAGLVNLQSGAITSLTVSGATSVDQLALSPSIFATTTDATGNIVITLLPAETQVQGVIENGQDAAEVEVAPAPVSVTNAAEQTAAPAAPAINGQDAAGEQQQQS